MASWHQRQLASGLDPATTINLRNSLGSQVIGRPSLRNRPLITACSCSVRSPMSHSVGYALERRWSGYSSSRVAIRLPSKSGLQRLSCQIPGCSYAPRLA